MKHLLTAALAALALGAAQAVTVDWTPASYDWTQTGTSNATLNLTNGCGAVVALVSTPASLSADLSSIFTVQDALAGSGTGTTFRMAGGNGTTRGTSFGVTTQWNDTSFEVGSSQVAATAGSTYLLAVVYAYDAATQTMTVTCSVNGEAIFAFSGAMAEAPTSFAVNNIHSYGEGTLRLRRRALRRATRVADREPDHRAARADGAGAVGPRRGGPGAPPPRGLREDDRPREGTCPPSPPPAHRAGGFCVFRAPPWGAQRGPSFFFLPLTRSIVRHPRPGGHVICQMKSAPKGG